MCSASAMLGIVSLEVGYPALPVHVVISFCNVIFLLGYLVQFCTFLVKVESMQISLLLSGKLPNSSLG
jgi:hypothetical protein